MVCRKIWVCCRSSSDVSIPWSSTYWTTTLRISFRMDLTALSSSSKAYNRSRWRAATAARMPPTAP